MNVAYIVCMYSVRVHGRGRLASSTSPFYSKTSDQSVEHAMNEVTLVQLSGTCFDKIL